MALLKFLIPLLFVVYSLGEVARIRIFSSVSSGIFDLVLVVVLLVWLFFIKKKEYSLKNSILLFSAVALFSLIINITKFSSEQVFISSLYLIRFVLYAGVYFVFADIGKDFKNKIPKYMLITGVIVIALGFLQYIFYSSLKNLYYLGWDDHMFRLFSSFLDPNFAGAFLVLFIVFIFIMRERLFRQKWKWVSYVLLLLNFIAIILTYSRGALLMLLVCVVIYSTLTKNWKITGALIGAFILIFFILSPKFYVENTNLLRFASTEARIETSKRAIHIFKENPMGVGFNSYRYARLRYEQGDWTHFGPSHAGAGVDNSFILVLVTTGILGLFAYIFMLYKIFKMGFLGIKKDKIALVLVVSLGGLIVNSMFINSLFYSFLMVWIWILAGLTQSNLRE